MKPNQYNPNVNLGQPQMNQPPSYSATSPEEQNSSRHLGINEKKVCHFCCCERKEKIYIIKILFYVDF